MQNGAAHEPTSAVAIDPATQKALTPTLLAMFKQHSVVNLTNIRYSAEDNYILTCTARLAMLIPQHVTTGPVLCDNSFLAQLFVHAHKQQVLWCASAHAMHGSGWFQLSADAVGNGCLPTLTLGQPGMLQQPVTSYCILPC